MRLARELTLIAAAAAGVAAIDTAFDRHPRSQRACAPRRSPARRDGFAAKLAIDPAQAKIINAAFDAARADKD